jgi:two-component system phosphate regulon sensor histidine kinase PhoR
MSNRFGPRFMLGMLAALVAAVGVFILSRDMASALIALVGAIIAGLVTLGVDPTPAAPAEPETIVPTPARLGSVLEAIVEPVLVIAGGRVEEANGAARDVLGNHITGQDVRLAIRHPAAAERLTAPVGEGSSDAINLVGLGTLDQRWELRVTDLPDGRRVAHLIDQTRSYAAERMRVDFVANASHELRTPLASILGFAETQRLVEDLISLSRIEAEKYRLPDSSVDLADLVSEVHSELMDSADTRAAEIVADIAANLPPVGGDRIQLSQALHNLIGNAMKYGRAGTPVTVKLWRDTSNMVRLSIGDEGDGIPPEHIPRLTERFYRVDSGRSRALGGTGLGLAIVKHIVERHRGRLDIASQVGRGTVVTILLPAALSSKGNAAVTEGPKPT